MHTFQLNSCFWLAHFTFSSSDFRAKLRDELSGLSMLVTLLDSVLFGPTPKGSLNAVSGGQVGKINLKNYNKNIFTVNH
jgi:hypothetical protein